MNTRTTINGHEVHCTHEPDSSATSVLRDTLGLTGTKYSCGAGVCGACTVLVNNAPCVTCLMPARALRDKQITTIEHYGVNNLHPVQRAFLAHDGLQCGFCTPGFVMGAIAFFERRRVEFGHTKPTREEIAEAMSGHLCRCGAYVGIYEAIAAAIAGDFDTDVSPDYARRDALEKVTGSAQYTVDVQLPGQLCGIMLGSRYAHAGVKSMNFARAEAIPGVKAVVRMLTDPLNVVRYVGMPVAAVAAIDEATCNAALAAIDVEYDVQPFVIDETYARKEGSPVVYPEKIKNAPNASEGPIPPGKWNGNVRTPILNKVLSKKGGAAERAVSNARRDAASVHLIEHTYVTPAQLHTAFEPHCCVAHWESADKLTVYASTQASAHLKVLIMKEYDLKKENVTVIAPYVGGAFGAKQGLLTENSAAIQLARKAGAPVKLIFSRREELTDSGCRPMVHNEFAMAVHPKGEQLGMVSHAYGYTGTAVQSQIAPWLRFAYSGPKSCHDYDVTTNSGPARPFRAPGGPPAFFALESAIDEAAFRTDIDAVSLRRMWDTSDVRTGLYDWVESIPEWKNRGKAASGSGRFRTGIGFAAGNWHSAYSNTTRVQIDVTAAEGVVASCAVQDMGQGARSVIAKAIADELGVPVSQVEARIGHSDYVVGPIATGSRTTPSIFPTSIEAARMMRDKLVGAATSELQLRDATWHAGGVRHATGHIPLHELTGKISAQSVTSNKRGSNGALDILGKLPQGELGISFFPKMTGSVCVMTVEVDTRLGRVIPKQVWMGISAGHIVNPPLADSQVYGAVIQNLGFTLTEERHYDPHTATLLSSGMEEYRIQGIGDTPPVTTFYDETRFSKMKGGASGLAELSTLAIPAALGNAVFHATGWRPVELPLTPNRVLPHVSLLSGDQW